MYSGKRLDRSLCCSIGSHCCVPDATQFWPAGYYLIDEFLPHSAYRDWPVYWLTQHRGVCQQHSRLAACSQRKANEQHDRDSFGARPHDSPWTRDIMIIAKPVTMHRRSTKSCGRHFDWSVWYRIAGPDKELKAQPRTWTGSTRRDQLSSGNFLWLGGAPLVASRWSGLPQRLPAVRYSAEIVVCLLTLSHRAIQSLLQFDDIHESAYNVHSRLSGI